MRNTLLPSLAVAGLAGLLSACASTSYLRPGFRLAEVQNLVFTPPMSAVAIVRTGYHTVVDSQATATSVSLLRKTLVRHRFQLGLQQELAVPDSLRPAARQEIYRAVEGIKTHPRLAGGAQLPVLDYVLDKQHQRYALVTAAAGFTQEVTKYDIRRTQSGNRSLPAAVRTPGPGPVVAHAKSNIYLFLYDRERQAIVYYTSTVPTEEHNPLDEASLEGQFSQMLRKDFPVVPH
ncbi:hypothetical protein [Hymenobacter cheonanensis]|uniref:hypothetical protein n=1 Tax=Hymenobacter sp. CA2-7 TaxID=3063993 RepID=UPI002712E522|nr:hypothetical protein [Hymenobacter sp. CA2-7]MDO7886022.1 hypothetical protein [Hymenobacter sp. CA2-7]